MIGVLHSHMEGKLGTFSVCASSTNRVSERLCTQRELGFRWVLGLSELAIPEDLGFLRNYR